MYFGCLSNPALNLTPGLADQGTRRRLKVAQCTWCKTETFRGWPYFGRRTGNRAALMLALKAAAQYQESTDIRTQRCGLAPLTFYPNGFGQMSIHKTVIFTRTPESKVPSWVTALYPILNFAPCLHACASRAFRPRHCHTWQIDKRPSRGSKPSKTMMDSN